MKLLREDILEFLSLYIKARFSSIYFLPSIFFGQHAVRILQLLATIEFLLVQRRFFQIILYYLYFL